MDVAAWLRDLGLERYVSAFRDNDIDTEVLLKLTAEDLISIGVTSVGHPRKLLDAIATLSASEPARRVQFDRRTVKRADRHGRLSPAGTRHLRLTHRN